MNWEDRVYVARELNRYHGELIATVGRALGVGGWIPSFAEAAANAPLESRGTLAQVEGAWRAMEIRIMQALGQAESAEAVLRMDDAARARARQAEREAYAEALRDLGGREAASIHEGV